MLNIITAKPAKYLTYQQAVLDVDIDNAAEKLIVMNRLTCEVYYAFNCRDVKKIKFVLPVEHLNNNLLLVGILDNNLTYNAKFLDAIKAEVINGRTVNIRG